MALHNSLVGADNHEIHAFTYANAAARLAAVGFVSADVGKVAKQSDDNSYYLLVTTAPVWSPITIPTGTNGYILTADNTQDMGVKFVAPGALTGQIVAVYTNSVAGSYASGAGTVINYGTMIIDTNAAVTVGAGWHFTVPTTGYYQVVASAAWSISGSTGPVEVRVRRNGSIVSSTVFAPTSASGLLQTLVTTSVMLANITDLIDVEFRNDYGAAISMNGNGNTNQVLITNF